MPLKQHQDDFLRYWRTHPRARLANIATALKISRDEANTLKTSARKLLSRQEWDALVPWATPEQTHTALGCLPPESHVELDQYAKAKFGWVEALIQNDLYPMALERHLAGTRRWDVDRDLVGTLQGSIRGIAWDAVKKIANALGAQIPSLIAQLFASMNDPNQSAAYNAAMNQSSNDDTPESLAIADEVLANIRAFMPEEDEIMWRVLNELLGQCDISENLKGKGTNQILAESLGVPVQEIENATKRLKRLLRPFWDPSDPDTNSA